MSTLALKRAKAIDLELGSTVASHALSYLRSQGRDGAAFGRIHIALRGVGVRCVRRALDKLEAAGVVVHAVERGLVMWRCV